MEENSHSQMLLLSQFFRPLGITVYLACSFLLAVPNALPQVSPPAGPVPMPAPLPTASTGENRDETGQLRSQLLKYAPKLTAVLAKHEGNARVVVVGDRVANFWQPDFENSYAMEKSWHGILLEWLAGVYSYNGGVTYSGSNIEAKKKKEPGANPASEAPSVPGDIPERHTPIRANTSGPAIVVEMLARDGAPIVQALQYLTTTAFDNQPHAIILQYGYDDAILGTSVTAFRRNLERVGEICRNRKCDLILAGPPLLLGADWRQRLGQTRPYAQIMKEFATANNLFMLDCGAAECTYEFTAGLPQEELESSLLAYLETLRGRQNGQPTQMPNPTAHLLFAKAAWKALVDPTPAKGPPNHRATFLQPVQPGSPATLEIEFVTTSARPVGVSMLGCDRSRLPVAVSADPARWQNATALVDLATTKKVAFAFDKIPTKSPSWPSKTTMPFAEERIVRGSCLMFFNNQSSLVDYEAECHPVQISMPLGRMEQLDQVLKVTALVQHQFAAEIQGTMQLSWRGVKQDFPVSLKPGVDQPLNLTLPLLGKETGERQYKGMLQLTLQTQLGNWSFFREIECSRNIRLDEMVTMKAQSSNVADAPPVAEAGKQESIITLTCMADSDSKGLYFIVELPPADSLRSSKIPSAVVEIALDGRAADKRGQPGFVDPLRLEVPWEDQRFEIARLRPAVFGDGYDRDLDPRYFLASVTTLPSGRRQVRLSIPRNYFYLHAWSLGKAGQYTLGLNATVSLAAVTVETPDGFFPADRVFSLVSPGMSRFDAQGLGVLELRREDSAFWSARLY